jgi:cytochrome oxidase Cu insertion factor (SCO1/SenC/PrrC family)
VLHSNRFVLIDRRGRIRAYRGALDLDLDRLLDDVRRLLRS